MNFYCINCASAKERWAKVEERFEAENIAVIRWNGWDNKIAGLRPIYPYEVDRPGSGYLMGERQIGIYLSHWMLWNYLLTRDDETAFIFEDDVIFTPGWKKRWRDDYTTLPFDWDLFYVGHCCMRGWKDSVKVTRTVFKVSKAQCLHAYMVRKKALPMMIEKCQKVWAPIDLALLFECQPHLNVFARIPRLIEQEATDLPP